MAIDQTVVAVSLMMRTISEVTKIHDSLAELNQIKEELIGNAITLTAYTSVIELNDALKHCDANTFSEVITDFVPQIKTALQAYYSGTPTKNGWAAIMKILA
jgi:hypothetical protein